MSLANIKAFIFDLDGLLINSEDLITACRNTILARYSRPELSWSIKASLQGRSAEDSIAIFLAWSKLPISSDEFQEQFRAEQQRLFPTAELLPGVDKLLEELGRRKVPVALATSSRRLEFELKTQRLRGWFEKYFLHDLRVLGDDARVKRHKPAPDVFLCALDCVNARMAAAEGKMVTPTECLVFEDSIQGVDAGRKAGMQVVWCPHPGLVDALVRGDVDSEVEKDICRAFELGRGDLGMMTSKEKLKERILESTKGCVRLVFSLEECLEEEN